MRLVFAVFLILLLTPGLASARDWYVRPAGGNYGSENGSSYENAWDGLLNVVWGPGGVEPGDSLYVCGLHVHDMTDWGYVATQAEINPISGTDENNRVTIRGDCPNDNGIVWNAYKFSYKPWVNEGGGVWSITLPGCGFTDNYFEDITPDSWKFLEPASSLEECISTPGSFYLNGSCRGDTIYVHTSDGGDPTNKVYGNRFGYHFNVRGKEYITFFNMTFYNHGFSLSSSNPSSHLRWENCKFSIGESRMFSWFDNCHYNEIINCDISGAGNGIYLISGTNNAPSNYLIKGNKIHDIGIRPSVQNSDAHCIGVQGGSNGIIEDNECYNAGSGVTLYAFTNQEMKNNTVRRNIVHDTHTLGAANSRGIETACNSDSLSDKSGNKFYQNLVYNSNICYRLQFEDLNEFYNNVAYNCSSGFVSSRNYNGIGAKVKFRNNIFMNNKDYHINWYSGAQNDYLIDSDYNLFYPDNGQMFRHAVGGGDMDFSEWKSHTTPTCPDCLFDLHSLSLDPAFIDPEHGNFHLRPQSPAIDNGTNVGLRFDFEGNPIPQGSAPDIGAYEYVTGSFLPGDLNHDGVVDIGDLAIIARHFGKRRTHPRWNATADVVVNNEIDVYDIVFVASRFGETIPQEENVVYATGLSPSEIQAAVDEAGPGYTVVLPAGTYDNFDSTVYVPNGISMKGQGRNNTIMKRSSGSGSMFVWNSEGTESSYKVKISGFKLVGIGAGNGNSGTGIKINRMKDFQIYDIEFRDMPGIGAYVVNSRGVIYNSSFYDIYPEDLGMTGYGVLVHGDDAWDAEEPSLGTREAVFIEDCYFSNCKHGVSSNEDSRDVVRHNEFHNPHSNAFMIDAHGKQPQHNAGSRTWEIYENDVYGDPSTTDDWGMAVRGGSGVIWNNNFHDLEEATATPPHKAIGMYLDEYGVYPDDYPNTYQITDTYVWGNTLNGEPLNSVRVTSDALDWIQEGRDYFMNAKPGYTPYPYPHPFRAEHN